MKFLGYARRFEANFECESNGLTPEQKLQTIHEVLHFCLGTDLLDEVEGF